jgi:hypothetical protein
MNIRRLKLLLVFAASEEATAEFFQAFWAALFDDLVRLPAAFHAVEVVLILAASIMGSSQKPSQSPWYMVYGHGHGHGLAFIVFYLLFIIHRLVHRAFPICVTSLAPSMHMPPKVSQTRGRPIYVGHARESAGTKQEYTAKMDVLREEKKKRRRKKRERERERERKEMKL